MADFEEYFPRGGKKPTTTQFKQTGNFLGGAVKEEKKKKKPKKKLEEDDGYLSDHDVSNKVDQSFNNCGLWLNSKVINEGFMMLGRVREVLETKLNISLPCRMQGVVMACHISEAYNKLLEAYVNDQTDHVLELSKMFRLGQYVAVKVLEVTPKHLMLSLMPQHINSGKMHSDFHRGALLQAAVSSVEDHGYLMEVGVPNTKVFLPKDSANPEIELDTGVVTWCTVKSMTPSEDSCVLTVTNELEALQQAFQRHKSNAIVPGTALEFVVDKPLDNGIEGHVFGDETAYIQRHHADSIKGKKPTLGQKIRARVLYVIPTKNIPFLTMKGVFDSSLPDLAQEQKLKEGDFVEAAKVLKILGRLIYFKLGGDGLGMLSARRAQPELLADEHVLAKSYPIGSSHRVRVLCYNLGDSVYSVSDEPRVLRERWFTLAQAQPGQLLDGIVAEVGERHLRVDVGRLKGYVPQAHMTDAGIFVDPKKASSSKLTKKFKVGQAVACRVLAVDAARSSLQLTLKPSLLAPGLQLLAGYERAALGRAYTGVVAVIKNYLLVTFFNNVTAYIPRHLVSAEPDLDLADAFHLGQIVKCTIVYVNPETKKMSASLITAPYTPGENKKATKRKHTDNQEIKTKKSKLDKQERGADDANQTDDVKEHKVENDGNKAKKKKDKKKDKEKIEEPKVDTEESDAIETDVQEEQVLTPQELLLTNLSDCDNGKNCKKRVVSLLKAVNARAKRLEKVEKKIQDIEEKGLNPQNKKYHTAMHTEKLLLGDRMEKLIEALKIVQDKLKDFNIESNDDYKKKKKDKPLEKSETKLDATEKKKKDKNQNDTNKQNKSDIVTNKPDKRKHKSDLDERQKEDEMAVLTGLKPVVVVPSAKEFWSAEPPAIDRKVQDESSSSEEEEEEKQKKKRKKLTVAEKVARAREEEARIREMEKRAIESESQPRSTEQFQRALLASPDCSQLWIANMAFHLQATEIEKARAVGVRALATINFREEAERLNVWLALLNLEHRFGTKETQQKTLEDALPLNDPYTIHSKLLDILVDTSKPQELAALVELMLRKHRRREEMYCACGAACFRAGLLEKARYVMQKGIATLEKKQHVSLLVQFAQLERARGCRERAEALFEQVLGVYPRRVDVAAAYADALLKGGDVDRVRQVMERLTSNKLPARKMKILYKKWIEIEEKIGDKTHIEKIRQRAMEFLDNAKY